LELGIEYLPAIIKENLTDIQEKQLATQCNLASETIIPTTFVDDAEFIWQELENHTQQEVGEMLGWSLSKIKQYSALKAINKEAWEIIVTSFQLVNTKFEEDVVTQKVTTVTFSGRLLKEILQLTPAQQLELVNDLELKLIESNIRTRKISTSEMARSIRRLYEIYDIRDGVNKKFKGGCELGSPPESLTVKDVADSVGLSDRQVKMYEKLNDLIPEFKTQLDSKQISQKVAYQIAQMPVNEQQELYNSKLELTENQVKQIRHKLIEPLQDKVDKGILPKSMAAS